jgi:hypothetical protein
MYPDKGIINFSERNKEVARSICLDRNQNADLGATITPPCAKRSRVLMPKYQGPELRLYRGASALERRSMEFPGVWSPSAAADFAAGHPV